MLKILLNDASSTGNNVVISLSINSSDMPSIPGDLPFFFKFFQNMYNFTSCNVAV